MISDLRLAFRQIIKSPGFTVIAVLTLALGLAVNAVFLTIANDLFFRPLPAVAPNRLVVIAQRSPAFAYQFPFSYPDAEDFRRFIEAKGTAIPDMARVFSGLMAYQEEVVHLSRPGESTERTWVHAVSDNYFTVLGVQPHLGRFFLPGEVRAPGADPVFILTYDAWKSQFNADPGIIGRTVKLNGFPLTVVGVAPKGFFGASWGTALSGFVPVTMLPRLLPYFALNRGNTLVFLMGRLKNGASLAEAQAAMEVAFARIMHDYPGNHLADARAVVMPESHSRPSPFVANYAPKVMVALTALSLLVLGVAIANVANLLYARAASRERELAIRAALGATRFHLIRALLAESAVLALIAGVVGAIASLWLTPLLLNQIPTPGAPAGATGLDWRPFVAIGFTSLLVGLASGLLPTLQASGVAPLPFLKEAAPSLTSQRHPLRRLLVVGQIAISCVVLVGASLALRSMVLLSRVALGFQPKNLIVASFDLGLQNYKPDQGRRFQTQLLEKVRALPGVEAASLSTNAPLDPRIGQNGGITAVGEPAPAGSMPSPVACIWVEHTFLSTLGLRLEAGRDFTEHDLSKPFVVIVNRALANQLWPGKDPISRHLSVNGEEAVVIGVAGRDRYYNISSDSSPLLINSLDQSYQSNLVLVVRAADSSTAMTAAITKIVHRLDPDLPLFGVQTMEQQILESPNGLMPYRIGAIFAGFQGGIVLLLAATGIFGLVSFAVARRTREIGVRMALGASQVQVIRAVTGESLVLTVVGLAVGIVLSCELARMLTNLLYGAGTMDIAVFGGVALLVLVAAILACWFPVRRATRIDPIKALHTE